MPNIAVGDREFDWIIAALTVYQTMLEMNSAVCQDVEDIACLHHDEQPTAEEMAAFITLIRTGQDHFVAHIARLTRDRDCVNCLQDGDDPNPHCSDHKPFDMENDDAVETLNGLIRKARALCERADDELICAKCGGNMLRKDSISDQGTGPEAGRTFYYCSERCKETH